MAMAIRRAALHISSVAMLIRRAALHISSVAMLIRRAALHTSSVAMLICRAALHISSVKMAICRAFAELQLVPKVIYLRGGGTDNIWGGGGATLHEVVEHDSLISLRGKGGVPYQKMLYFVFLKQT